MKPKRIILLVDDNEIERSCTRFLLETRGYRVVSTGGAAEALAGFQQGGVSVDLALVNAESDCGVTEAIKRLAPETPVFLYSRTVRSSYQVEHQADRFLPKGTPASELLEYIRLAMTRKRGPKAKPAGSALQIIQERATA